MSIDVDVVCHECQERVHLGQEFTSGWSFGYGTGDIVEAKRCGEWIMKHLPHHLSIMDTDSAPTHYASPVPPL